VGVQPGDAGGGEAPTAQVGGHGATPLHMQVPRRYIPAAALLHRLTFFPQEATAPSSGAAPRQAAWQLSRAKGGRRGRT